jgi:hypothetical protein
MQTQTVRTTVNFDYNLYRQLTYDAATLGTSLSRLVNDRLLNPNLINTKSSDADWDFFRKMAKKYGSFDSDKALREERDRDHA